MYSKAGLSELFESFDVNKNRKLNLFEMQAYFDNVDLDGDERISPAEFLEMHEGWVDIMCNDDFIMESGRHLDQTDND
jgi:hypothetical protein